MKASLNRLASGETLAAECPIYFIITPTLAVGEAYRQSLGLWLSFADVRRSIPYPASVTANVR